MDRGSRLILGRWLAVATLCWAWSASAAVHHVAQQAPGASDDNPGTEAQPLKTISASMKKVQPGDTVLVKDGTYREAVVYPPDPKAPAPDWKDPDLRLTLSAFPGHRPVIKGSEILTGQWERLPGDRPIYALPRDIYTQMVFVDEERLRQIGLQGHPERPTKRGTFVWQKQWDGKGLADMVPGSFFYDAPGKRLNVWLADGSDPSSHVAEAAVRPTGIQVQGTWTVSGFDVRHIMDGLWPTEQAVALTGNRCVLEGCRITQNEFLGLIVSGEDCVIRNNVIAENGLEGCTSNFGFRMLFEGNELHHNAWRGDVVCLTAGNKWVMWRESKWVRNWWHDEPACALWLDISDGNALIAENRFDNCKVGVYFEISRWAVIANNVFRHCGMGIWSYSSDVLIAHNILDSCGDGIVITGSPRLCNYTQVITEPISDCLMAVRNNLVVNNILIDCPGSFIGITEDDAYGAGNSSDYNAFVWTLPAFHTTGNHINFMPGWNNLYARLPEWRIQRHYDTHSVIADPGLLKEVQSGSPYVVLSPQDVVADAGFEGRERGDYRLLPNSALRRRGVTIPAVLNSGYIPGTGREAPSRQWAKTRVEDAPDPKTAKPVSEIWGAKHYRLQPLPAFHRLVDLEALPKGDPGLNLDWLGTQRYPTFDSSRKADVAADTDWLVFPDNRLADPSFTKPLTNGGPKDGPGPWYGRNGLHLFVNIACANLLPAQQEGVLAYQKIGIVAPECEYVLFGDMEITSRHPQFTGLGELYLATGEGLVPFGPKAAGEASSGKLRAWQTYATRCRSGKAGEDPAIGKDLYVVIQARCKGPADLKTNDPVVFLRWDNLTLLSGEKR